MTIDEFLERADLNYLYHFTDEENLPSIRKHGLLPYADLQSRRIQIPKPGGNEWSHDADKRRGLDHFVHLCLKDDHPMEYQATQGGHLGTTRFLRVSCAVLRLDDLRGCATVANKSDAEIFPLENAFDAIDLEVLFEMPWQQVRADAALLKRYNEAKKAEILVPSCIPPELLLNLS